MRVNGTANGHVRPDRRVHDAEEFELEGLISDEDEPQTPNGAELKPREPLAVGQR